MEFLTGLYLFYTFVSFYFLFLYTMTYIQNKKQIYEIIKPDKIRSLSIVVPCFNAEETIGKTIEAQLKSDYKGLKQIIISDDCSTDGSADIIKSYAKKYKKIKYVKTPKNTGNAAGAKNYGAKFVNTELIGFSDDDSIPGRDAISNMVGFFNDIKIGGVTSRVLVTGRDNFLVKSQAIEYKIIAFTRKLLGFLGSIYVTNGPLSIYRKGAYDDIGGFDTKNLTEDIEFTWKLIAEGWGIAMSVPAVVYTSPPSKIKEWFVQRVRWNIGGIQTMFKYKGKILANNMLGRFIVPFFAFSWFIGLTGLFFLVYRFFQYILVRFLVVKYSVAAQVALVTMNSFKLNPSILFIFGVVLVTLGLIFTFLALGYSREGNKHFRHGILGIFIYSFFYLLMYPPLLIVSAYKYFRGYNEWGGKRFEDTKK